MFIEKQNKINPKTPAGRHGCHIRLMHYISGTRSSIRCAPQSKSDLFAGMSKVKSGLPHSDTCCANCSVLLPSEAWAIHILSASAATNALRWLANPAVERRCLLSKIDRSNRRPSANATFHAGLSRIFSMLRAGQRIIGCEPRSRTRRHSFSTGE